MCVGLVSVGEGQDHRGETGAEWRPFSFMRMSDDHCALNDRNTELFYDVPHITYL
jgi:hypothetical protein